MIHETAASPSRNPSPDELLHTLRLCLRGERVLTASLRRELAVRGLDLEALALQPDSSYSRRAGGDRQHGGDDRRAGRR